MNTFSHQVLYELSPAPPFVDWLDCEWGGPYDDDEEEFPPAVCGSWGCAGDCYICVACEGMLKRILIPIQGPVNRDGIPLGFLLITE